MYKDQDAGMATYSYQQYLKPLLMPILAFYVFLNARKNHYRTSKLLIFIAFVFAWAGDIVLLNNSNTALIIGLVLFVGMHVAYTIFFFRLNPFKIAKATEIFIGVLILLIVILQFFKYIKGDLHPDSLKIYIIIYAVVISIMALSATNVLSDRGRKTLALNYFVPGAALFLASDMVLALNRFSFNEPFLDIAVLMSYGYAQCLLAQGFTKYLKG
jgi:uncharacterized membrane protein YhhN